MRTADYRRIVYTELYDNSSKKFECKIDTYTRELEVYYMNNRQGHTINIITLTSEELVGIMDMIDYDKVGMYKNGANLPKIVDYAAAYADGEAELRITDKMGMVYEVKRPSTAFMPGVIVDFAEHMYAEFTLENREKKALLAEAAEAKAESSAEEAAANAPVAEKVAEKIVETEESVKNISSDNESVSCKVENGIATITMNRPKSMNALNDELADGLHAALDRIEKDESVRVVVLTGAGKAFCAGGDIGYLSGLKEHKAAEEFVAYAGSIVKRIAESPKPFIAYVNGAAAGAGINFMLACDIIIVSDNAKFSEAFTKVGLIPDCGGFYFLPGTVGMHKAKELMMTADVIGAAEAKEIGLVNQVYAAEETEAKVYELAEKLKKRGQTAVSLTKKYLNQRATLDGVLAAEPVAQAELMLGAEGCEGMAAFLEKREAKF